MAARIRGRAASISLRVRRGPCPRDRWRWHTAPGGRTGRRRSPFGCGAALATLFGEPDGRGPALPLNSLVRPGSVVRFLRCFALAFSLSALTAPFWWALHVFRRRDFPNFVLKWRGVCPPRNSPVPGTAYLLPGGNFSGLAAGPMQCLPLSSCTHDGGPVWNCTECLVEHSAVRACALRLRVLYTLGPANSVLCPIDWG